MSTNQQHLEIVFDAELAFSIFEEEIREILGENYVGSGMVIGSNKRDMTGLFTSQNGLDMVIQKLNHLAKMYGTNLDITTSDWNWN